MLFVAAGLGACSSKESKFKRHMERAAEFTEQDQTKEALLELRSALQLDPKSAEVNYQIAELFRKENRPADAAFHYRETTRLDPTRSDAALAEAKLTLFDDPARAEELIEGVLQREPNNAIAYVRRSELALAKSNSADALTAALTATELDPKSGRAFMQLGIVHLARLRERALKNEETPEALYQDAEKAFQRAAELYPTGIQPRIELGRLYSVWAGHGEQAKAAYRSAIDNASDARHRARAASAALGFANATNDQEFLKSALEVIVDSVPERIDAWAELASLEERRQAGAGDAVYKRLLEKRPDDIEAHVRYAGFLYSRDRRDEAFAHLESQANGPNGAVALEQTAAMRIRSRDLTGARETVDRLVKAHPTHPRTELAKGRIELAENRVDEAAATLRRYIGMEDTAEGQHLLANAELRRGNYPAAVAAIDRALELGGTSLAAALRLKATIHSAAGDHPQTLQTLNRMQRDVGRMRSSDKLLLAQTLYAMNRRPRAKAVLEELLADEKPPVAALVEFAQREIQREPQRARAYLEQALVRQPSHPQALRLMAQIELGAGRPADALARIDKAAEQGPLPPALLLLRAQVLASQKDWVGAEEEARRAFAAAPTLPGALELLANIYVAQGRLDEAIASFVEAEKAGALPASGQQLLARLYLQAGRTAEAKALYEKVLAARADMPGAKNDLAWILAQEGAELDRALTLAQEAQQAEPESPEVADTLGYVYFQKGLHDPALEQFKYAIELAQRRARNDAAAERPDYHYHKGLALQSLGRAEEAADAFGRALSLDGDFAQADDARRRLEATKSGAAGPG
ncbi:MAG: hypothetical protein DCC71_16915 [Proteobacteria bacterium]|nr:MAG: hypothetical protein DCC71_16915 [Pseudomonadota bacterium]